LHRAVFSSIPNPISEFANSSAALSKMSVFMPSPVLLRIFNKFTGGQRFLILRLIKTSYSAGTG
jgi:hypothetical protein